MRIVGRVKRFLQRVEIVVHHNLLAVDAAERSRLRRGYRLIYYTLRGVNVHRTMVDSAALTLYTLLALVPMLTLVLLVLGQVGVVDKCVALIYESLPNKWDDLLDGLLTLSYSAADKIAPGLLAVVGVSTLLFMVFALYRMVEEAFNRIFDVVDTRGFIHRYVAYIIIALFVPTLILASLTFAYDLLTMVGLGDSINSIAGGALSLLFVAIAAMLMYKYLPYTRVKWRYAIYAGVIVGTALSIWLRGYVFFQQLMTSYNVVYGSLAAIPLFIIWLQVSWNIILFGCELCAAWQYRHRYDTIDRRRIKVVPTTGVAPLRVVIIGSGNVAEAFARAIGGTNGVELVQVLARNSERGMMVAKVGGCDWIADPKELAEADIYMISVSDRSVKSVAESLVIPKEAILVHTAGSVPIDALPKCGAGRGIFYPLQSFTAGRVVSLKDVPIFVEADSADVRDRLMGFAAKLSSRVEYADSERRRVIHLAGVFVNNFVNHLYGVGGDVVGSVDLDFEVLKPLIAETAAKAIATNDPESVQTGPAVRGDVAVTDKHLAMLEDDKRKQQIYKLITESIWETSKRI